MTQTQNGDHDAGHGIFFLKITVAALAPAQLFYETVFGFVLHRVVDLPSKIEHMLQTSRGGRDMFLILNWERAQPAVTVGDGWGPLGIGVADVDRTFAEALALGATPTRPPFDHDAMRIAYFRDLDGYEIEIVAPR